MCVRVCVCVCVCACVITEWQEPEDMESKPIDWLMPGGQADDAEAR